MKLRPARVELKDANEFVARLHRHHKPVTGHRFSLAVQDEVGVLHGVAICGRPVARMLDQKNTLEVTRLCTDGTPHACSFLYAAAARCAKEMAFSKIQTYILDTETGTSLKAAGFVLEGHTGGGDWNRPSRGGRRVDQPMQQKSRWVKDLAA